MSRTITALFDSRQEAEAAADRLRQSRIDADRINIIDQSSQGYSADRYSDHQDRGFWASLKDVFLPDDDRYAYEEGVRRGGVLVSAQVDEGEADEAIRVLEEANSVDFDSRQEEWRSSGWTAPTAGTSALRLGGNINSNTDLSATGYDRTGSAGHDRADATLGAAGRTGSVVNEEHIPIVEEQLRVGKREVARGGARVRSYVVEKPVHEQVTLREEHVSVERRPVNETLRAGNLNEVDALRDREIEMTETAEEAVVAKEAVVREELVVRKTAEERVENIDDTVRRTEVEVDEGLRGTRSQDDLLGNRDRTDRDRF